MAKKRIILSCYKVNDPPRKGRKGKKGRKTNRFRLPKSVTKTEKKVIKNVVRKIEEARAGIY